RAVGRPPGTSCAGVTSLGPAAHRSADFTIGHDAPRTDLGTVRLAASAVEADEIAVTVERETVTLAPDRNAYLAKDVAPAATSASEVLENVPSVQVDPDGQVSLRGNSNVAIQINGRPAPVRGEQLAAYLQQLPANVIDRVEVIPTPSAAQDPEGMAGIVNIVMKQNADLGTSAGFTASAATSERYNVGANLGYQRGPITLFTTYGFYADDRDYTGINDRERLDAIGSTLSLTEQDLFGENLREGHNLSATLDWSVTEKDVLTNVLTLNRRAADEFTFSGVTELDGSGAILDRYARPRDGDDESFLVDYTLGHKRTWEPRKHELSSEIRFNRSDDDESTLLWRQSATDPSARIEIESQNVDALDNELVGQLDYTRPLGEFTKLETGYKGTARWLDRDYTVLEDELGSGVLTPDPELSNAFTFEEQVQAVYGVVTRNLGTVELQGGLRAEYASQDFALADESFPHDYTSLFPSAIAVWNANETTQLKASFSRRVDRPGTQQLNPFPVFFDTQNVFLGNPELDPEYTNAFELGYTRSGALGSIQVTPYYRHTTDVIRFVVDTDAVVDGREVTTVSFENLDRSDSYGVDVNGSIRKGPFNGFASFNVFKMKTDGGSVTDLSSDAVTWSGRVNGSYRLTPSTTLQGMMFYRAPMEFETGKFSSFKMTAFTLQQKITQAASLTLRVIDPFATMGFRVEAGDENLFQITERDFDARAAQLTFQYTFGKTPKVRQPRPDTGDEGGGIFPQ
ncbi:MAG: TonB-dependent receptor, partial [Gemmatimonadetes bacterium]|nr:TonB-dependent receptor [Gemmatimonadota bacterium]